jgi:hypothetical protein
MTDYFSQAERLLKPQEEPVGFRTMSDHPVIPTETLPADRVAAQVHATLAVAEQLSRIATALERLAGGQEDPQTP